MPQPREDPEGELPPRAPRHKLDDDLTRASGEAPQGLMPEAGAEGREKDTWLARRGIKTGDDVS